MRRVRGGGWVTPGPAGRPRRWTAPPRNGERNATLRHAIGTALLVSLCAPALAQTVTTEEYYVVRDPATKKCTVVNQKPATSSTTTIVGQADAAMKKVTVCTTE